MVNSAVRSAIESLYDSTCTVVEKKPIKDPVTKITRQEEVETIIDQPCRLSFESIKSTNPSESAASLSISTKLFVSPDIEIKPGSKIIVTKKGTSTEYKRSGEPAVYGSHQEIMLELFKGWS